MEQRSLVTLDSAEEVSSAGVPKSGLSREVVAGKTPDALHLLRPNAGQVPETALVPRGKCRGFVSRLRG